MIDNIQNMRIGSVLKKQWLGALSDPGYYLGLVNVVGGTMLMLPNGGRPQMNPNAYHVTKNGVTLPKGYVIPADFIENSWLSGSYGIMNDGFVELIRIDAPTPHGRKGPNYSHFHINKGHTHLTTGWPYKSSF